MKPETRVPFMSSLGKNHVGNDTWSRLSKNQRRQIIKNRHNAPSLVKEFANRNGLIPK